MSNNRHKTVDYQQGLANLPKQFTTSNSYGSIVSVKLAPNSSAKHKQKRQKIKSPSRPPVYIPPEVTISIG